MEKINAEARCCQQQTFSGSAVVFMTAWSTAGGEIVLCNLYAATTGEDKPFSG